MKIYPVSLVSLFLALNLSGCNKPYVVSQSLNLDSEAIVSKKQLLSENNSIFLRLGDIYDNMLSRSRETKCHFQSSPPNLLYKISYSAKIINRIAYDNDNFYIIGKPTLHYKIQNGIPDIKSMEEMDGTR